MAKRWRLTCNSSSSKNYRPLSCTIFMVQLKQRSTSPGGSVKKTASRPSCQSEKPSQTLIFTFSIRSSIQCLTASMVSCTSAEYNWRVVISIAQIWRPRSSFPTHAGHAVRVFTVPEILLVIAPTETLNTWDASITRSSYAAFALN